MEYGYLGNYPDGRHFAEMVLFMVSLSPFVGDSVGRHVGRGI